ncbi:MAG TPA: YdcH family protein [Verrucomicrobiae bacterium]|nr:YdcH family protein [Verrucomicrobiae bacterium]
MSLYRKATNANRRDATLSTVSAGRPDRENGLFSRNRKDVLPSPARHQPEPIHLERDYTPMDLHHPILREFPEHREVIRRLKGSDDHFRKMFDEYHRLDDSVYRIEEEIDFATDQEIEELKLRRAKLKDYIYHLIRHAPPACPACEGTGIAH